ncbi:hypothetical protein [Verminephrobacter aporrectodeae]|uniref:hypothetical protein n=1 Tax=Verminephrobacter aporrectodeae TaxID=1110389 RepID=UPI00111058F3|nr:hypothetical protein [Verminephrobacter aporrectodeae]
MRLDAELRLDVSAPKLSSEISKSAAGRSRSLWGRSNKVDISGFPQLRDDGKVAYASGSEVDITGSSL